MLAASTPRDDRDDIGQALLNVDVRPVRIAFVIAEGSHDDFKAAVVEASTRWGGIQEPIVPMRDGRVSDDWRMLLDLVPVDYICAVSGTPQDRITLQDQLGKQVLTLEQIQPGVASLHATATQPFRERPSNTIGASRDDPIISLTALGAAWDKDQLTAWQRAGQTVFPQPIGLAQLVGAQLNDSSLIAATGRQCGETTVHGITGGPLVVWLARPDSFEDALWYWNFRSLIPLTLAHFPSCLIAELEPGADLRSIFDSTCRRQPYLYTPDVVVYSRSVDRTAALGLMTAMGFVEDTSRQFSMEYSTQGVERTSALSVAYADPIQLVVRNRDLGQRAVILTFLRRKGTIITVESPVRFRQGVGGQVRIRFSGPTAFQIPESPSAARLFHENAVQAQGYIELTTRPANNYTLQINIPDRMSVLSAYLGDRLLTYRISDKGRLAAGIENVMPDIARLRNGIALKVIDALTTHRFEYELKEVARQFSDFEPEQREAIARALLNVRQECKSAESIFSEMRMKGVDVDRATVGTALTLLIDAAMVLRGLQADCRLCGMTSFMELSATTAPAVCPGCKAQAAYTLDTSAQPVIHYRLNALLDRASDQGVLGHVVVTGALRDLYGDQDVINLPGVDITTPHGITKEADSLALVAGEVWLGEVKARADAFTPAQIERDLALADAVGAKTYLIVCLEGVDQATITSTLMTVVAKGLQLAVLDSAEGAIRIFTGHDIPPPRSSAAPSYDGSADRSDEGAARSEE